MNRSVRTVPGPRVGIEILVVLILAAAASLLGYWIYTTQKRAVELDVHEHLREVTDLKASEVAAWRREREGDAKVVVTLAQLSDSAQQELQGKSNADIRRRLVTWLDSIRASYQYASVALADSSGAIHLVTGQLLGPAATYAQLAREAARAGSIHFHDLPPGEGVSKPHFVLAAGLKTERGQTIGALLMAIDPAVYLYPVVLRWPSPTRTGQVVLLRRTASEVVFLSDLEGVPGAAMRLRRSLSNRASVSVRAALGEREVDGRIANGERVEGAAQQVPDSDWFVAATMHADEAYEPLNAVRAELWIVGGLLILMAAAGIEVIRRRQLSKFYRQQYQAEIERRALLGHYDYLTRYANDAVLLIDNSYNIVEVNDRSTDYFGYSREELLGMSVQNLRTPEGRARAGEVWAALRQHKSMVYETMNLRKDGSRFPTEISARLIDVDGKEFVQTIIRDITERKQAEEQIRRLNRLYRVLSQCGEAIITAASERDLFERVCRIAAEQGGFRLASVGLVNETTQQIEQVARAGEGAAYLESAPRTASEGPFGMGPSSRSVRQGLVAVCNDIQADPHMSPYQEAAAQFGLRSCISLPLQRGGKVAGQLALYSADPGFFNSEEVALAKEIAGSVSFALDAQDRDRLRRQAESELLSSRERLELVLDASAEGYWDWNLVTGEGHLSPRHNTMLGYQPGDVPATFETWPNLVHPDDQAIVAAVRVSLLQQDAFSFEVRVRTKAGNYIWCLSHGKVVTRQADGRPMRIVGTNTDITARKKLEEQFLQAQKLESVGRLAGGVAHDFNNLLTVINGYSDLLMSRLEKSDPLRTMAEQIRKAGESAASLTQQLLTFSRLHFAEPKPLALNAVVAESRKMLSRLVGEHIEVVTELKAAPDTVLADRNQIHQCVMNLIVNARDAMPQGGRLLIETANVEAAGGELAKDFEAQSGRYVLLAVTDTGTGMNAETRSRIFEPFFTTKETGKGTGLGLSTVYGIVQQCNGFIRVDSEPGRGSSFRLYLPRTDGAVPPETERPGAPESSGSETILVVEDQENVRGFLAQALQGSGYSVLQAGSGAEALQVAQRHTGPIHLLLTDMVMPAMNGEELARRMRPVRPAIKVLFMSGYTGDMLNGPEELYAGIAHLPKPFTLEALAAKIREALAAVDPAVRPTRAGD